MAYFSDIQIGDKFYVGEKEFKVDLINYNYEFRNSEMVWFNSDGCLVKYPDLGQIAFWQPVHIDPPPRPKRKVKKWTPERWVNYYLDDGTFGRCRPLPEKVGVERKHILIQIPPKEYEVEE